MKSIINNNEYELIVKNSRFISLIYKFKDGEDLNKILDEVKEKYPKATHYTYAYITESSKKSSDDGEPGGTAGTPILNVLEKEKLINVLVIIVRYFGGIKLGAGGLFRAYSKACSNVIDKDNLIELVNGYLIKIEFNYDQEKDINYKLKDYEVINKEYTDRIIYEVLIPKDDIDILSNLTYEIIDEKLIRKQD